MAKPTNIFDNLPEYTSIETIIEEFDFELVRSYMLINKWTIMTGIERGLTIPTVDDLKNVAQGLLEDVVQSDHNPSFISTAGFFALKWGEELSLYFNIENYTTELGYD